MGITTQRGNSLPPLADGSGEACCVCLVIHDGECRCVDARSRQLALQAQEASTSQQASQEPDQGSPMQAGIATSLNQLPHESKLRNNQIHPETLQNSVASDTSDAAIDDAQPKDDDADY